MNEGKTPFREASIPISQLLLDIKNPRFPEIEGNQRDAIRAMVQIQGEKIIALANHILDNGPNPANLLIVMPATNDAGNFVVLDGNRRFTALKLLETPTLIEGVLNGKALQRLKRMSSTYKKQPLTEMRCIVFNSRDEADTWIQLTHRGYQSGAGLVEWDGQVAARYDSRKGDKSAALQVLDFVKDKAPLSEKTRAKIEAGKFPITNLERLINTPYVRKKLGIDVQEDKVVTSLPDEEVLKGLARVIEDLGSGEVTVSNIKSQAQRIDYINSLNHTDLPQADSASGTLQPLGATVASGNEAGRTPVAAKPSSGRIGVQKRSALIPKSCKLRIGQPRLVKIVDELKALDLDVFPNAGAVMLRVFIELSLDHFLEHPMGKPEQEINSSKFRLKDKLIVVANYMEQKGIMTQQQLLPIRNAAGGETLLAASVRTLHGYIHNKHFSPVPSELRTAWDNLQPFIENLWPSS